MHMADALIAPVVAATMYVASGTVAGVSVHKLKKDEEPQKLPRMDFQRCRGPAVPEGHSSRR